MLLDPVRVPLKKRRCLGPADVLTEVVEREISQLSTEEACQASKLCLLNRWNRLKIMEEGAQGILRLEQEAYDRGRCLFWERKGNSSDQGVGVGRTKGKEEEG